jgi:hypothetical protein
MTDEVVSSSVHLFDPRPQYRFLPRERANSQPDDPAAGENPAGGAAINFYVDSLPVGGVRLEILTEGGELIVALPVRNVQPGLNRVMWNLRYPASSAPQLRTAPIGHSHREVGQSGWRPAPDGSPVRPLAIPGRYQVRLTAGDAQMTTWLEVLQDPESTASQADLQAQLDLQLELREMSDSTSDLISRIEWTRKGLIDLEERVGGEARYADVVEAGEELSDALIDLEMTLFDLRLTGGSARQDTIRWPRQLWAKIASLAGYSSGSDDRPTDQAMEVRNLYRQWLTEALQQWAELTQTDLARFNRMLVERGLPPIVSQQ